MDAGTDRGTRRPSIALLAAVLVGLQGVIVLVGGIWLGTEIVLTTDNAQALGIALGLMAALIGGVLLAASVGVRQGRTWARGPTVTWQVITAFIAMVVARNGIWWIAVPLFALAVATGVLLAGPWVIRRRDPLEDGPF